MLGVPHTGESGINLHGSAAMDGYLVPRKGLEPSKLEVLS